MEVSGHGIEMLGLKAVWPTSFSLCPYVEINRSLPTLSFVSSSSSCSSLEVRLPAISFSITTLAVWKCAKSLPWVKKEFFEVSMNRLKMSMSGKLMPSTVVSLVFSCTKSLNGCWNPEFRCWGDLSSGSLLDGGAKLWWWLFSLP